MVGSVGKCLLAAMLLRFREATYVWMWRFCEESTSKSDAMTHKLYENFLDDPETYQACVRFWENLANSLMNDLGQAGKWYHWIPHAYAHGEPIDMDGNPIFDGRSEELDRAFRIIQHRAIGDEVEIAAWLKAYEEEYADLPQHELVLNLSLSEESARVAGDLLCKWMTPETTPDDMEAFIAKRLIPQGQSHR